MSSPGQIWTVAAWEFGRYFKPRQQLVSILILVVVGLGTIGVLRLADRQPPVDLAVVGIETLDIRGQLPDRFRLDIRAPDEEPALQSDVEAGELDGLLVIRSADRAELTTGTAAAWTADVERALSSARQEEMLRRSQLSPDMLAGLLAPPEVDVRILSGRDDAASGGERLAVIAAVSLMLLAVFTGMSYIFASITGEKQIRVTEQVISAIPAQTWIDGKILGLAAVSMAGVASTLIGVGILFLLLRFLDAGFSFTVNLAGDPVLIIAILAFGTFGLLFWFAFLTAIAAMIDDPHSSTRNSFLFLPMLATAAGFLALRDPGSGLVRALSLFPPTAPGVMPPRLILMDVHPLETAASLLLLVAGGFLLRLAAGRVFRVGMLMYGKEPTWREVRRWIFAR